MPTTESGCYPHACSFLEQAAKWEGYLIPNASSNKQLHTWNSSANWAKILKWYPLIFSRGTATAPLQPMTSFPMAVAGDSSVFF